MAKSRFQLQQGSILVATSNFDNSPLVRSVIILTGHDEDGSRGILINKPLDRGNISDLIPACDKKLDQRLYCGGWEYCDQMFSLHKLGDRTLRSATKVTDGIYTSIDKSELERMIHSGNVQRGTFRIFKGLCTWEKGLLEEEMYEGSWIVKKVTQNFLSKVFKPECDASIWSDYANSDDFMIENISRMLMKTTAKN